MSRSRFAFGAMLIVAAMATGAAFIAYGDQTGPCPRAEAFQKRRLDELNALEPISHEIIPNPAEFVPRPNLPRPSGWVEVTYFPVPGPNQSVAFVPNGGMRRLDVPWGHADCAQGIYLVYDLFALAYYPEPEDVREDAIFQLGLLVKGKEVRAEVADSVKKRIEKASTLDLMREHLALCVDKASITTYSEVEAVYNYVLTKALPRFRDGQAVRELRAGRRVVFCYGRKDIGESCMIHVIVYEDSRPLYEVCLMSRSHGALSATGDAGQSQGAGWIHVLRSLIECGLNSGAGDDDQSPGG